MTDDQQRATPFHDLDSFVALPRLGGLVLTPDGSRLVTGVTTLDPQRTRYVTALWEIDPSGRRPARRLTRGAAGESAPTCLPDGSVLFRSTRPDPEATGDDDDAVPALWLLPPGGGEARVLVRRPGGVTGVAVAAGSGTVVVASPTMPAAVTGEDDAHRRARRRELAVGAILHESYPVRYWDHDLGPDQVRLLVGTPFPGAVPQDPAPGQERLDLRDLTPAPGRALDEADFDLAPDGRTLVTTWLRAEPGGRRSCLATIDVVTGRRALVLDDPECEFSGPRVSPDGTTVALQVTRLPRGGTPPTVHLALLDLATGRTRPLARGWQGWPSRPVWTPDGRSLLVTADRRGCVPVFRVDVATGQVLRLTDDHGAYGDLQVSPDGAWLYALRSAVDSPPLPVRLSTAVEGILEPEGSVPADDRISRRARRSSAPRPAVGPVARPEYLPAPPVSPPSPGDVPAAPPALGTEPAAPRRVVAVPPGTGVPELPGSLTEVRATAEDGAALRSWLVLPRGAGPGTPAPLLVWIHGGPLSSWNSWSWRWNPWLAAAAGYAVLLPDPALSTGYGEEFVRRGWGRWGEEPFTDLMALTDAAVAREDVDASRTAAMGGSFGGYMANWVAGHTDRFRGIVTHASLWALDQFGPTTDAYGYWRREATAEMVARDSPHLFVDEIRTPMLIIHGDRDYRVPIAEAVRMWAELAERSKEPDGVMEHKFLYFPDENHWVLSPQHARVWYQTVLAFLAHTVLGEEWAVPEILR